ncbi:MAG: SseB family protein, partial [Streptosporangiaceae bacterium]
MEWSEFARRFALELAALDRDTILIVREREESRHYVQAMRETDRLYAESVSNNFLEGPLLLTPADEEILNEAGWQPPTAAWNPANWWTELSPRADHTDYTLLADMMVTALRDVQGVRRPASLVYESFHRHGAGLIELTGFGIETADRQRITESRPAPEPVPLPAPARPTGEFEARLSDAKQRGDHSRYFDLLLAADLVLPATGPAVEDPGLSEFATTLRDGSTHLLAFTSPQAMSQSLGAHAGLHRRSTFTALAGSWPNPAWSLTVNTGLPSEISLDAAMIARLHTLHRTPAEDTMVDSFVLPPVPPDPYQAPELRYGPPEALHTRGVPVAESPFTTAPVNGTGLPADPDVPFDAQLTIPTRSYAPEARLTTDTDSFTSGVPAEMRPGPDAP